MLFSEGDGSNRVVLLVLGRVKVSSFSEDGHETVLGYRGPGDVLGELSAIDGGEHSATVTVVEAGEALVVPAERFLAALEAVPVSRSSCCARSWAGSAMRIGSGRAESRPRRSTWSGGSPTGW